MSCDWAPRLVKTRTGIRLHLVKTTGNKTVTKCGCEVASDVLATEEATLAHCRRCDRMWGQVVDPVPIQY